MEKQPKNVNKTDSSSLAVSSRERACALAAFSGRQHFRYKTKDPLTHANDPCVYWTQILLHGQ